MLLIPEKDILVSFFHYFQNSKGWKIEVVNADETGIGGMKEVEFMVKGQGAYSVMKYESGVHCCLSI